MSFTRKRPRDGPPDQPVPKRHDHKAQDKFSYSNAKQAAPAPVKPVVAVPAPAKVATKVVPPPPKTSGSVLDQETAKFDVQTFEIKGDLPGALQLLEKIRGIATELVEKVISLGAEASKHDEGVKELERRGFVLLSQFRTFHRLLHLEVDQRRQQTSQFGERDFTDAMQALLSTQYEHDAYKTLVELKPAVEAAIGLLSEDEYLQESSQHSLRPKESDTAHQILMKRIRFEEEQRRNLGKKLKEIPAKQNSLKSTLNGETRDLEALKQKIRDIGGQINSLKQSLKLEDPTHQPTDPRAPYLPQPLYNLYVQFISWISVFGGDRVEVAVSGSIDLAKRHLQSQDPAKPSPSSSTYLSTEQCQATHPLSVIAQFVVLNHATSVSRKTSLIFEYLTNLNIVIVTPSGSDEPKLLVNLFSNKDSGLESPNWSNRLIVAPNTQWLPKRARSYEWLQSMCGLHFQKGPNEMETSSPVSLKPLAASLTDTMELLKRRTQIRYALGNLNSVLASGRLEVENWKYSPNVAQTALLRKWTEKIGPQAQKVLKETSQYYQQHHLAIAVPLEISEDDTYFCASFGTPESLQTIQVIVKLEADYPFAPSTYFVTGSSDFSAEEVSRLMQALKETHFPIPQHEPEKHIVCTLLWLRDCVNIAQDVQKNGSNSKFNRADRYAIQTWQ